LHVSWFATDHYDGQAERQTKPSKHRSFRSGSEAQKPTQTRHIVVQIARGLTTFNDRLGGR
jgi:hypothetical protein